ncbi:gastrula zinc finger protein XlCGF26.1 [Episyrphus balteatus]|uniref:gastrula zinc finger protein XlCGF26.1 n=1 Tax=Episyrphus balteatus TaxID=286459 RepID=UPI00248589BA|nr:gastrula zinc finger protein XlCGF26.1 [Episyrphus balteatus]
MYQEIPIKFESKVSKYLDDQRKTGTFCDLKIELQSGISAWGHFCVIGAQSEFIGGRHFLQKSLQFSIHNPLKIKIHNFSCTECLQTIIDFFYQDVVSINQDHEDHFKKLAKILSVKELLKVFCIEEGKEDEQETPKQGDVNVVIENLFEEKQNYFKVRNPKAVNNGAHSKINYCIGCDFKCYKVQEMVDHMTTCSVSNLTCCLCEVGFFSNKDFDEHLRKHVDSKPFFCFECDSRFLTKTALNVHHPKHSIETPYVCPHCSKGFKWKQGLTSHLQIHKKEKEMLCDVCGYSTTHMKALKSHKLTHTGELFKCTYPDCTHTTNRKENLKIHMDTHKQERPFVCEVCGYKFSQNKNLKRHALKHAENTKRHKCQLCDFDTHRSDKLKEHVQRIHTEKAVQLELPETVANSFELKTGLDDFPLPDLRKEVVKKVPVKRKPRKKPEFVKPKKPRKLKPKAEEVNQQECVKENASRTNTVAVKEGV